MRVLVLLSLPFFEVENMFGKKERNRESRGSNPWPLNWKSGAKPVDLCIWSLPNIVLDGVLIKS